MIPSIIGMKQIEDPTVTLNPGYCQLISNYYKKDGVWFQRTGATKVLVSGVTGAISSLFSCLWQSGENQLFATTTDIYNGSTNYTTLTSLLTLTKNKITSFCNVVLSGVYYVAMASEATPVLKYNKQTGLSYLFNTLIPVLNNTLNLTGSTASLRASAVDKNNDYMYVASNTSPSNVYKVRISDYSIVSTLTLTAGENIIGALVIDSSNTYMYGVTNTSPVIVVKIQLSDFTRVGILTLDSGENSNGYQGQDVIIDKVDGFLYTGVVIGTVPSTSKASVVKVRLSDFTRIGVLSFATGSYGCQGFSVNTTHLYCTSTNDAGSLIKKILLSNFTEAASLDLSAGNYATYSICMDSTYTYIYCVAAYSSLIGSGDNKIFKVDLSSFTNSATLTLTGYSSLPNKIIMDSLNLHAYISTNGVSSNFIHNIDITTFTRNSTSSSFAQYTYSMSLSKDSSELYIVSDNFYIYTVTVNYCSKYICNHQSKFWMFGIKNSREKMYARYSATLSPIDLTTVNDAGTINFGTVLSTIDDPTGVKSWGDYIVFSFNNITLVYYAGTNPNDFKIVKKIANVGGLSKDSIIVGKDLWFPTIFGIKSLSTASLNGEIVFGDKGQDIDPFWNSKITAYGTNTDRISMKYDKIRNQIMVLANDSANQGVCFYVYSVSDKVWSTYNVLGLGAAVSITAFEITQDGLIYFGTSDGNIYQLFSGTTDNGTAISYVIRPTTQYFSSTNNNKKVKFVQFGTDAAITSGSISYDIDQKGIPRSTQAVVAPSSGTKGMLYSKMISVMNRGKSWDFTFTNCGLLREISFFGDVEGQK